MADTAKGYGPKGRNRRFRGRFSSGKGKTVGIASLAAPVIGFIVNDLRKPDSVVRGLISGVAGKLLGGKKKPPAAVDISKKVEVTFEREDTNNK